MRYLELTDAAQIVGWIYFVCWTVGVYPQIYLNCRRKSVVGLSLDRVSMAFLGCLAYFIYTITLYCDAPLQKYFHSFERQHFKDRDNTVKLTDVVFGIHGLVMMFAIILQIGIYEKRISEIVKDNCRSIRPGKFSFCCYHKIIIVATEQSHSLSMWALALIYAGYVKSGLSIIEVF